MIYVPILSRISNLTAYAYDSTATETYQIPKKAADDTRICQIYQWEKNSMQKDFTKSRSSSTDETV